MKYFLKKLLCIFLTINMVMSLSFIAHASTTSKQKEPDNWAKNELIDADAMNLLPADFYDTIQNTITDNQLTYLMDAVQKKLDYLDLSRAKTEKKITTATSLTRENIAALLFEKLTNYEIPDNLLEKNDTPMTFMARHNIIVGYGNNQILENRLCSLEEAVVISTRFLSVVYNGFDEASNGLLWKVVNGNNTLYLLGSVHADCDNLYPLNSQLNNIINSCDNAVFEVDYGNENELNYFKAAQKYSDGTSLKNHITADLYEKVVRILTENGLTEDTINSYKPWALANYLNTISYKDTSNENNMSIDNYIYKKTVESGKNIDEVEGYKYQADLFNSLSEGYQESYLKTNLEQYIDTFQNKDDIQMESMITAWRRGNAPIFEKLYNKDYYLQNDDELTKLLYTNREEHMSQCAKDILEAKDPGITLMVVGSAHMIGETGIVSTLENLGYIVTPINTF